MLKIGACHLKLSKHSSFYLCFSEVYFCFQKPYLGFKNLMFSSSTWIDYHVSSTLCLCLLLFCASRYQIQNLLFIFFCFYHFIKISHALKKREQKKSLLLYQKYLWKKCLALFPYLFDSLNRLSPKIFVTIFFVLVVAFVYDKFHISYSFSSLFTDVCRPNFSYRVFNLC